MPSIAHSHTLLLTLLIFLATCTLGFGYDISECTKFPVYHTVDEDTGDIGQIVIGMRLNDRKRYLHLVPCFEQETCLAYMSPINAIIYLYFKQYFTMGNVTESLQLAKQHRDSPLNGFDRTSLDQNSFIMSLARNYFIIVNGRAMPRIDSIKSSGIYNFELSNHSLPLFNVKDKIKSRHCELPLSLLVPADVMLPKGISIIDTIRNTMGDGYEMVHDIIESIDETAKENKAYTSKTQSAKTYVDMAIKALESMTDSSGALYNGGSNLKSTIDRMSHHYKINQAPKQTGDAGFKSGNIFSSSHFHGAVQDDQIEGVLDLSPGSFIWNEYEGYYYDKNEFVLVPRNLKDRTYSTDSKRKKMDEWSGDLEFVSKVSNIYNYTTSSKLSRDPIAYKLTNGIVRTFFSISDSTVVTVESREVVQRSSEQYCESFRGLTVVEQKPVLGDTLKSIINNLVCTFDVSVNGEQGWIVCIDNTRTDNFAPDQLIRRSKRSTFYASINFGRPGCIPKDMQLSDIALKPVQQQQQQQQRKTDVREEDSHAIHVHLREFKSFQFYHSKVPSRSKILILGRKASYKHLSVMMYQKPQSTLSSGMFVGVITKNGASWAEPDSAGFSAATVTAILVVFFMMIRVSSMNHYYFEKSVIYAKLSKYSLYSSQVAVEQLNKNNRSLPVFKRIYKVHFSYMAVEFVIVIISVATLISYLVVEIQYPELSSFWLWFVAFIMALLYETVILVGRMWGVYDTIKARLLRQKKLAEPSVIWYTIFKAMFSNTTRALDPEGSRDEILTSYVEAIEHRLETEKLFETVNSQERITKPLIVQKQFNAPQTRTHVNQTYMITPFSMVLSECCVYLLGYGVIILCLWSEVEGVWDMGLITIVSMLGIYKMLYQVVLIVMVFISSAQYGVHTLSAARYYNIKLDYSEPHKQMWLLVVYFATLVGMLVPITVTTIDQVVLPFLEVTSVVYERTIGVIIVCTLLVTLLLFAFEDLKIKLDRIVTTMVYFFDNNLLRTPDLDKEAKEMRGFLSMFTKRMGKQHVA